MKSCWLLLAILVLLHAETSRADWFAWRRPHPGSTGPTAHSLLKHWCCDDYCMKPPVRIPCAPPGCSPDDYCMKPFPKPPCPAPCGCVDDYCPKPAVHFGSAFGCDYKCGR